MMMRRKPRRLERRRFNANLLRQRAHFCTDACLPSSHCADLLSAVSLQTVYQKRIQVLQDGSGTGCKEAQQALAAGPYCKLGWWLLSTLHSLITSV